MTPNEQGKRARIHGFDLIRLVSFFVVSFYHFVYALWNGREELFYKVTDPDIIFNHSLHPFERAMAFSGHTLLFLSMMLIALAKKSYLTTLRFSVFLVLAWALFVWSENEFKGWVPAWDIHPLIFVGLITIVGVEKLKPSLVPIMGLLGFLLTLNHWSTQEPFVSMNVYARSILVGDCSHGVSSWPLLPWLGFLYSGYAVGFVLREERVRERFSKMSALELGLWIAFFAGAMFHIGAYYRIPQERFECDAFNLPPTHFYSDFIFVLFAMRLSLLAAVDRWLAKSFGWVGRLNVSRNFFLAYALQYALAFIVADVWGDAIRQSSQLFMWIGVMMLPAAELIAWTAAKIGLRRLFKGGA